MQPQSVQEQQRSEFFESMFPEGPVDNKAFYLYANQNNLWVATGGRSDSWNNTWTPPQFQLLKEGNWHHFTKKEIPEMESSVMLNKKHDDN